jgi:arabinogalactan endo-1,4-beta-galactosidase
MPQSERIAWLQAHIWPYVGQILAAVADGIRTVQPHARFSTHVSGGAAVQPALSLAFYKAIKEQGFVPDEMGFSFYPTSREGSLSAFKETATEVQREFGRPVFIAEYGYPSGTMRGPFAWNIPAEGFPLTPAGQAAFTRELVSWGRETGILSGIRPWAPDFTFPGWEPMSFFELRGKTATAKPALTAIQESLQAPLPKQDS